MTTKHNFTTKSGKSFEATLVSFGNKRYAFSVNGFEFELSKNELTLSDSKNMLGFLNTIGVKTKPAGVTNVKLQIDEKTTKELEAIGFEYYEAARIERMKYIDSLPTQYFVRVDGLNADGDLVAKKLVLEKMKVEPNGTKHLVIGNEFDYEPSVVNGLVDISEYGFGLYEVSELEYSDIKKTLSEKRNASFFGAEDIESQKAKIEAEKIEALKEVAKTTGMPQEIQRETVFVQLGDGEIQRTYIQYMMPDGNKKTKTSEIELN